MQKKTKKTIVLEKLLFYIENLRDTKGCPVTFNNVEIDLLTDDAGRRELILRLPLKPNLLESIDRLELPDKFQAKLPFREYREIGGETEKYAGEKKKFFF